jgi:hypothetical protein
MIYKFKSKATGDLIMMGPNGDQVMRIVGREPQPTGIFEVKDMPALIAALERAVAEEAAAQAAQDEDDGAAQRRVSLRQRVWPLVEMLRRAHAAGEAVVWGV